MNKTLQRDGYLLMSGLLLFMLVMLAFPLGANLYYSFSAISFETIRAPELVGIGGYLEAVRDQRFWKSIGFSLRFGVITTVVEVGLGLLFAVAFEPILRNRRWLIALLLLPMMISPALMGVMYKLMLNDFVGMIPQYLTLLGFRGNLLGPDYVVATVAAIEILQWTPFAFLILLAAYQSVPQDLIEAARIDGANAWQVFSRVALPHMQPALVLTAFIRFLDGFRVFDHIFILTGGGPGTRTTGVSIYLYKTFFVSGDLGRAIAASMILLLMTLGALVIAVRYIQRAD